MIIRFLLCLLALSIMGCSQNFYDKDGAGNYIKLIHEKYNKKDFSWMYRDFSSGFRLEISEDNFATSIERVRSILGEAKTTQFLDTWQSKKINGQSLQVYRFHTKYDNGSGIEVVQFELEPPANKPKVFRYEINSDEIMRYLLKNSK